MQRHNSSSTSASSSSRSSTPTRLPPKVLQSVAVSSSRPGTPLRTGSSNGSVGASPQVKERIAELRRAKAAEAAARVKKEHLETRDDEESTTSNSYDTLSVQDAHSRPSSRASSTRSASATSNNNGSNDAQTAVPLDSPLETDVSLGFGMGSLEEAITAAKKTGRLNIASRSLSTIPDSLYEQLMPSGSPYHPSNSLNNAISSLVQKTVDFSFSPAGKEQDENRNQTSSDNLRFWEVADITVIKASSNELTYIPDFFAGFSSLSVLDLHSNLIQSPLPASFGTLTDLTILNLSNNGITEWPIEIMALVHLRELDLSRNKLKELWPKGNGIWKDKLKQRLKSVNKEKKRQMSRKEMTTADPDTSVDSIDSESTAPDQSGGADFWSTFPSSPTKPSSKAYSRTIDETDYTAPLPKLVTLNVSHNKISASAFSLEAMDRLPPSLVRLDLSNNGLNGRLPLGTFGELRDLKELNLASNGLDDDFFSETMHSKFYFPSLESLDLSRNALDSLEHLENCLSAPESRQIQYSGVSSSSLKKALASVPPPPTTDSKYPILRINLTENLLREEGIRRKELRRADKKADESIQTPPANSDRNDMDTYALQARGQEILGILDSFRQNLSRRIEAGDLDENTLHQLSNLVEPLRNFSFSSGSNSNNMASARFPTSIPAGLNTPVRTPPSQMGSSVPNRLVAGEERDPSSTSWSARRKRLQEASQGWAPL